MNVMEVLHVDYDSAHQTGSEGVHPCNCVDALLITLSCKARPSFCNVASLPYGILSLNKDCNMCKALV